MYCFVKPFLFNVRHIAGLLPYLLPASPPSHYFIIFLFLSLYFLSFFFFFLESAILLLQLLPFCMAFPKWVEVALFFLSQGLAPHQEESL